MKEKEFLRIIASLRANGSELANYEAKAASRGLPKKLVRTICAFANKEDGGMILLGVGDAPEFALLGVEDVDALQRDIANLLSDRLLPSPELEVSVIHSDQKKLIAARVKELNYEQKPCYDKREGIYGGAYKRVSEQDRLLSPYEIFLYQSNTGMPRYDISPVEDSSYPPSDPVVGVKLNEYTKSLREESQSDYLRASEDREVLSARRIICGNKFTLMGFLATDPYPQRVFPKLRISYTEPSYSAQEDGLRYINSKTFEGPIREILDDSLSYILGRLRRGVVIKETVNQRNYELPKTAIREALLNAVAHRDYSPMALGRDVQVRLFADRLEIENPGGLFAGLRVDSLRAHQSASRNSYLATLLEDLGLMENRGDGILSIYRELESASLAEPRLEDLIDSFRITLYREGVSINREQAQANVPKELINSPQSFLVANKDFARRDLASALSLSDSQAKTLIKKWLRETTITSYGIGKGTRYKVR